MLVLCAWNQVSSVCSIGIDCTNISMQTCDDVYGKICGENNLKNGALEMDFSTTALPLLKWLSFVIFVQ